MATFQTLFHAVAEPQTRSFREPSCCAGGYQDKPKLRAAKLHTQMSHQTLGTGTHPFLSLKMIFKWLADAMTCLLWEPRATYPSVHL